jgi:hypothetical protein
MPYKTDGADDLLKSFLQMMLVRAMQGESQIQEQYHHGVETKAKVQAAQAISIFAAVCLVLLGMGLIGGQLAWLMDLTLTAGDYLLVFIAAVMLLAAGGWLASRAFSGKQRVVQSVMGLAMALLITVAAISAVNAHREEWSIWRAAALVVGMGLIVSCGSWAYRQLTELLDEFGKTSPMERMMMPYLEELFGQTAEPQYTRLVPYRRGGEQLATSNGATAEPPPLHPDDQDLLDFIEEAQRRGLSRGAWLDGPKYKLPTTGNRVTRDRYDTLVRLLAHWGFIALGGDGAGHDWLLEPDQALEILQGEMSAIGLKG